MRVKFLTGVTFTAESAEADYFNPAYKSDDLCAECGHRCDYHLWMAGFCQGVTGWTKDTAEADGEECTCTAFTEQERPQARLV